MPMRKEDRQQKDTDNRKTSELNQWVCIKDVLTSEWKAEDVLCWERVLVHLFTGEKLWIQSKLIKIRFEMKKPLDKREMTAYPQR